ncbi:hypothetical protein EYZ11_004286 [Aspergillus tanneri]|uniref:endo-1,3(4)-beta-glucanase n=1 Tax=Aspergillus tanneri TaxID=1220188 RepID=A0A4S3JL86_9EURO|nr:uncharacterized protein ATNIH1004_010295 [Aspergillus tanneri]KAA8643526.1 hypothetical protein ATNIH1004_010295 [Aspergillus tanneri]THC96252.1 hypothetical protein EYZ11_004286 [Aspergillus tanneri]
MHVFSTLFPVLGFSAQLATAAYTLRDDYGPSFFDKFTFFTAPDPTNGFVKYVDRQTAQNSGLISTDGSIRMGVDSTNVAPGGRQSVRITSNQAYDRGLFILDLDHMPGGICGTWPAFWLVGPNWPNNGEVDIIEGVNDQSKNKMALHTSDGCKIDNTGFSGSLTTSNCFISAPGQDANAGCGIEAPSPQSYGTGFNGNGGGVFATEITGSAISIWFFPHGRVPGDIGSGNPNPSSWGTPDGRFAGACDINAHFKGLQIVFDTTFCGDWAGGVWGSSGCASKAGSCQDFVANNPSAFTDAFWKINSLKVYQSNNAANVLQQTSPGSVHIPSSTPSSTPTTTTSYVKRHHQGRHAHIM